MLENTFSSIHWILIMYPYVQKVVFVYIFQPPSPTWRSGPGWSRRWLSGGAAPCSRGETATSLLLTRRGPWSSWVWLATPCFLFLCDDLALTKKMFFSSDIFSLFVVLLHNLKSNGEFHYYFIYYYHFHVNHVSSYFLIAEAGYLTMYLYGKTECSYHVDVHLTVMFSTDSTPTNSAPGSGPSSPIGASSALGAENGPSSLPTTTKTEVWPQNFPRVTGNETFYAESETQVSLSFFKLMLHNIK